MPIFMDRHHIKGASARAVADAHQKDLKLQAKYGVKLMTYWFDEARGSAFCLMDAPATERVRQLHEEAHGLIPNKIMEVDPQVVELFLGRIQDIPVTETSQPHATADPLVDSAFRAVMFTDMKDSTAMLTRLGESRALDIFRLHNAMSREMFKKYAGREIQHTGDGFFVSFTSAANAVDCAINLQKGFAAHNTHHPNGNINVRIGICAGEPIEEDQRLFGSTVQMASRICSKALPDQILVAPIIREICQAEKYGYRDLGDALLKGFQEPTRIFEVDWR